MRRINLLFRHPAGVSPNAATRVQNLNRVFAPADIEFAAAGAASMNGLTSVNIGVCNSSSGVTPAQQALFNAVQVGNGQAVAFLATALTGKPGATGCSNHPPNKPGVTVRASTGKWVLAHEIGHMLGLDHNENTQALMFGNASQLGDEPPPLLLDDDLTILRGPVPFAAAAPEVLLIGEPELANVHALQPAGEGARGMRAARRTRPSPPSGRKRPSRLTRPTRRTPADAVDTLVRDALARVSRRRSPRVIGEIGNVIDGSAALKKRYRAAIKTSGKATVHRAIAQATRKQTGMVSSGRVATDSELFTRYAILEPAR